MMGGKGKAQRNGFFYFTQEFKSKNPQQFDTANKFFEAAGPQWSQMTAEERRPYEDMAKRGKVTQKPVKYTTTGIDVRILERRQQQQDARKQKAKDDIDARLAMLWGTGRLASEYFYIIHINYFCQYTDNLKYVPAELAVARFTLNNGVPSEEVYHIIVHPGQLQVGYSSIVKDISENSHQLPPPVSYEKQSNNMHEVFLGLKAFMRQMHPSGELPPVFAEDKNMQVVVNVLNTLIYDYGGLHETFCLEIQPLDYFLFALRNQVNDGAWPQVSISTIELEKDVYDYCLEVTCPFHKLSPVPNHCSKSHVMRKAYVILDQCCRYLDIELIPGKHVPTNSKIVATRPSSRASTVSSSYVTAHSAVNHSTFNDEYLSVSEFSETGTLVDSDEYLGATGLSYNESAYTNEEIWEQPKSRSKGRFKKNHSQGNGFSQDSVTPDLSQSSDRSRRPVTLSAAMVGLSLSNSRPSGILSIVGRGRGRGFSEKH